MILYRGYSVKQKALKFIGASNMGKSNILEALTYLGYYLKPKKRCN